MTRQKRDPVDPDNPTWFQPWDTQGFTALDYDLEICLAFIGARGAQ